MASGGADGTAARPPGATAAPPGVEEHVHHDIARDIGQQVELMILEAKHQSETKVGKEIQRIKQKMDAMQEKIKLVTERVSRLEVGNKRLHRADFQKSIAKLEEVWEGEVGTLKHELWQTIQAHNHNADLLKHHKEAIDQVQNRMNDAVPNPEAEQVHSQLMQVDKIMQREVAKEHQMDQLMSRLTLLQQTLSGGGHWGGAGVASPFQLAQAQAQAASAAAAAQGKPKAKKQVAKSKPKAMSMSSMQAAAAAASLRAEAPEFVPTTAGWTDS